ncbi:MAG TPA: hypothetical protein VME70_07575 [Mycobacteriales bacterium]|nr:hypothetical protein [Mycobacteriales bacterium]
MIIPKAEALAILQRAGMSDVIAGFEDQLPDPIDTDRDEELLASLGITRARLMERMGHSP